MILRATISRKRVVGGFGKAELAAGLLEGCRHDFDDFGFEAGIVQKPDERHRRELPGSNAGGSQPAFPVTAIPLRPSDSKTL